MSIEDSATFTVMEPETMRRMFTSVLGPDRDFFIYSRHFNPTVLNLGRLMAAMEAAYCTASGMSAVSSVLLQLCSAGGHGKTNVLYFETMSNPTLTVATVPELCRMAHDKGITVVVDNTFSPMVVSQARLGADVVVHSMSTATALVYATRMKKLGLKVIYPGLEDNPDHATLKSMAVKEYGYGGLLCVDMETEERANRLMNLLQNCSQFGLMAVSLGYYETLMSCSGSSTSSEEEKELAGISPGLVRMSIGFSGTLEQKWSHFTKALRECRITLCSILRYNMG
ncbi:hypothetical protein SASPL_140637 [Salvia splendens]|uniref:Cystathionine gamma-synthase n=1 Tax=Salvia splendens TaxID=180675 RepID=A0A8X8ZBJ4_SALSN|nr:hypothetical protein SASPL_140637 [Salvia splendens]